MKLSEKQLKNMIAESVKDAINEVGRTKKRVSGGLSENKVRSLINKKVRQVINESGEDAYQRYVKDLEGRLFNGRSFFEVYGDGGLFLTAEELEKITYYFECLKKWKEENNYNGRGF